MGWNKLKSLFVVSDNPSAAPADPASVDALIAKYQVPAEEPPVQLPPSTNPAQLSGTIDFQGMYDQAGIPNTDEVEGLEKFLVELDTELPQASKLAAAKAFL